MFEFPVIYVEALFVFVKVTTNCGSLGFNALSVLGEKVA